LLEESRVIDPEWIVGFVAFQFPPEHDDSVLIAHRKPADQHRFGYCKNRGSETDSHGESENGGTCKAWSSAMAP